MCQEISRVNQSHGSSSRKHQINERFDQILSGSNFNLLWGLLQKYKSKID